jgi:hypothetical protein
MATFQHRARRLIVAGGFAVAITIAPAVAVFVGPTAAPAPRTLAQTDCTGGESMDAYSLACVPDVVPGGGAPSEGDLTAANSDESHSGSSSGHGR